MKKLRLLAVSFDTHINPWDLNKFRGAVSRKVGLEHEWFHNHDNAGKIHSINSYLLALQAIFKPVSGKHAAKDSC